jgi:hypothetical protein
LLVASVSIASVSFYAIDQPFVGGDENVAVQFTNIFLGGSGLLQYSTDGSSFSSLGEGGTLLINTDPSYYKQVFLRIAKTPTDFVTEGLISFSGGDPDPSKHLYNTMIVIWNDGSVSTKLTIASSYDPDKVSDRIPAVPIPASLPLFASGLIGLVGIGRGFFKKG